MKKEKNKSNSSLLHSFTPSLLLKAVNLSHSFDYLLFENVNLSLKPKETIAIVGPSGCPNSPYALF